MMPMVAAFSLGAGPTIIYDLSALSSSYTDQDTLTTTYKVEFAFRVTTDGTVDTLKNIEASIQNDALYVDPPTGNTLYVRCTQNSGTAFNVGDTVGSWLSLTAAQARSFGLSYTTSGGPDQIVANIDLEVALDAAGTNVVASKAGIALTIGETA